MAKFHLKYHVIRKADKSRRVKEKSYFWFALVANNGKTLITSEIYLNPRNALKWMESVVRAFASDGRILESYVDHTDGKPVQRN